MQMEKNLGQDIHWIWEEYTEIKSMISEDF